MKRRAFARGPVLSAIAAALAGCDSRWSALVPAGDQAAAIRGVWDLMIAICGTMYVLVLVGLAYALLRRRSRAREGTARDPAIVAALVGWVVLTLGLLSWLTAASFLADRRLRDGRGEVSIRVTAKQWWWDVEYLDPIIARNFRTANELHLPRDRTAHVELRSGDVIHSFWVPSLSGKHDMIPGRVNALLLTPRVNGYFRGQCAEFCGLQHAHMALDVQVEDDAAYRAWADRQRLPAVAPTDAAAQRGLVVYERAACAICHRIGGTPSGGRVGPDLTHLATRRSLAAGTLAMNRGNLAAWIVDPQHAKPGNNMPAVPLTPQDVSDLVAYLSELK
ncbi:cytochrome c oxidase subunit II [Cognatilysobacter segetis]|uniref:cytochrome c oxidase subunit II n=1 Tax=Cognatilysobacter segetis TaxID=2492394 RepID=UPI00105B59B2|nr:cytochrome c oxidase subunit II [Lysobacter segetis]